MSVYDKQLKELAAEPRVWAVTGVAGFIGSNILQRLLAQGQRVVGLDSFVTGSANNLADVQRIVGPEGWARFRFIEGDIRDSATCHRLLAGADFVLHQAALGSVPLSLERPDETHAVNVSGFLNMLMAAREENVRRFVYASSCAVYGDDPDSPKVEDRIGHSISPYATTKRINELYADVFSRCYELSTVGLRYFNVYGRRQDPHGAYAAVIPRWIDAFRRGEVVTIFGDGKTSRDFCFVWDVVQANILAATAALPSPSTGGLVANVGTGVETSLNELASAIREMLSRPTGRTVGTDPVYAEFRPGDIRHSRADIARARTILGFAPQFDLRRGLEEACEWYGAQIQAGVAEA